MLLAGLSATTIGCASFAPKEVGLVDGRLRPCPPAPKCVSSYYNHGIHHIDPLRYTGTYDEAYRRLIAIIGQIDRSKIVTRDANYIHAQFSVTALNWIDNTEFLFDDGAKTIHFSSTPAAPIGFWDWGENRRRAVLIKTLFEGPLD